MAKSVAAFVEDSAHRRVLGALVMRTAAEVGVDVAVDWRSARRGHGRVIEELKQYLRDLRRQGDLPDFLLIGTDANCRGPARRHEIPVAECPVPVVLAIPDPHIERWLLVDGAAFKEVFDRGCKAPDLKCERARYKEALIAAIRAAGTTPSLGGIEFADDIIAAMDLDRASTADTSLGNFLSELRAALKLLKR
jgi:hypothetical protein